MIAVWFSCGAPSAVAAKLTIEKYGESHEVRVLNNPIAEEDEDNRRFLKDAEAWLGQSVESVVHPKFPNASAVEIWDHSKAMVFPHGAPCTRIGKKQARQEWEKTNIAAWHVLGFTLEEKRRHERFVLTERSNVLPVLIDASITRADCFDIVREAGLKLPSVYDRGYPNANCIGCVKATSPTYWNHVRKDRPDVFEARAEQSRRLGARLVRFQNKRIFLDELPETAKGRAMKVMPECGLFCEEKI